MRNQTNYAQIDESAGQLAFSFSYNAGLVAALKAAIPATDRGWDGQGKVWLVTPGYGQTLQELCFQFLGVRPDLPKMSTANAHPETTILEVRYVGRVKTRPDGSESAFGWWNGGWNVIFPGAALKAFFGADPTRPDEAATLYVILGVDKKTDGAALKKAWRRAAQQWHPDHCAEPDAADQFRTIQEAYEILGDPSKRARYDAGLLLEASLGSENVHRANAEWQPPLRCGYVMARGVGKLGRFVVDKVLAWEDIRDANERVLVVSWPSGADKFVERWV